jgi:pterin-4a-carbinolamine dehydratase
MRNGKKNSPERDVDSLFSELKLIASNYHGFLKNKYYIDYKERFPQLAEQFEKQMAQRIQHLDEKLEEASNKEMLAILDVPEKSEHNKGLPLKEREALCKAADSLRKDAVDIKNEVMAVMYKIHSVNKLCDSIRGIINENKDIIAAISVNSVADSKVRSLLGASKSYKHALSDAEKSLLKAVSQFELTEKFMKKIASEGLNWNQHQPAIVATLKKVQISLKENLSQIAIKTPEPTVERWKPRG